MKLAYTILFVVDVQRSREFYSRLFAQEVDVDFDYLVGFKSGLALWAEAEAAESVGRPVTDELIVSRGGAELEFHSADIEGDFRRLQAAGVAFVHEIITHPWQQRAFRCFDPDGHCIEVAELLSTTAQRLLAEGKTIQEVAGYFRIAPAEAKAMVDL